MSYYILVNTLTNLLLPSAWPARIFRPCGLESNILWWHFIEVVVKSNIKIPLHSVWKSAQNVLFECQKQYFKYLNFRAKIENLQNWVFSAKIQLFL